MKLDENLFGRISPLNYAIVVFLFVPVASLALLTMTLTTLILWPLVPFFAYFQRKQECKLKTNEKVSS